MAYEFKIKNAIFKPMRMHYSNYQSWMKYMDRYCETHGHLFAGWFVAICCIIRQIQHL